MLRQDLFSAKQDRIIRSNTGYTSLILLAAVLGTIAAGYLVATGRYRWTAALAAVSLVLRLLTRPELLLKFLSFLAPIYWLPFVPPTTYESFRDVLFLAFFVALAFGLFTHKLKFEELPKDSGLKFITLFLIAMIPSVLISPSFWRSSVIWLRALQAGLFYVGLLLVLDREQQIRQLLVLFMLGQLLSVGVLWLETISVALGVSPPWTIPFTLYKFGRGELGLSYRRTAFANTTAHVLPIVLELALARRGTARVIGISTAVLTLGAIVVSRGRAGLIAALVVIYLVIWKRSRYYAMVLLIVAVVIAFIFPSLIRHLFVTSREWIYAAEGLRRYDRLLGGRIAMFISAIELIKAHPFFGAGLGSFRSTLEYLESLKTFRLDRPQACVVHNLYLQVGSESGIIAALALITFMIWALHKGWKAFQAFPEQSFASVLFGVLAAQFVTSLFEVEILWTIMRAFPFWIALTGIVKFYAPKAQLEHQQ